MMYEAYSIHCFWILAVVSQNGTYTCLSNTLDFVNSCYIFEWHPMPLLCHNFCLPVMLAVKKQYPVINNWNVTPLCSMVSTSSCNISVSLFVTIFLLALWWTYTTYCCVLLNNVLLFYLDLFLFCFSGKMFLADLVSVEVFLEYPCWICCFVIVWFNILLLFWCLFVPFHCFEPLGALLVWSVCLHSLFLYTYMRLFSRTIYLLLISCSRGAFCGFVRKIVITRNETS